MSIESQLRAIQAAGRAGAARGLLLAGEHVLGAARDHVPHEESTLERSGNTSQDDLTVAVSFDTPYAVVQHEDLTLTHDPGRNAKYLENALNSERGTAAKVVATEVARQIGT